MDGTTINNNGGKCDNDRDGKGKLKNWLNLLIFETFHQFLHLINLFV